MASSGMKLGREDYKKKKELEEFRKLGAAPAEVDDDGYSINPHIPQYMAEAPWYLSNGRPGLRHQRLNKDLSKYVDINNIVKRGFRQDGNGNIIRNKKWKIGSCDNCGASSHSTKECVYRPRKFKAKHTNLNIKPEEHIQNDNDDDHVYSYDAKHDRWNNYNIANHQLIIERHQKIEQKRREKKAKELDKEILNNNASKKNIKKLKKKAKATKKPKKIDKNGNKNNDQIEEESSDSDSDSDSDDSDLDSDDGLKDQGQVIQRFDSKKRQTVRNLRIREDLPKYLRNLSTNSAYYDPKTRSMRANPYNNTDEVEELYMGDNFIRQSGDAVTFNNLDRFAWQSRNINGQKSSGIHLQSNPTMTELAFKQFNKKKNSVQNKFISKITAKYGGEEYSINNCPNVKLLYGQSEMYREFGSDGRIIKGQDVLITASKYIEDIYNRNHTEIWGSWYDIKTNKWGYKCCHCVVFNAYCTGNDGRNAANNNSNNKNTVINDNNALNQKNMMGVAPRPKEFDNTDKLVNPSGYISTRGIMAAKGIARKQQKEKHKEMLRKMKKREKKKKRKAKKKLNNKRKMINDDNDDGYSGGNDDNDDNDNQPPTKKQKIS